MQAKEESRTLRRTAIAFGLIGGIALGTLVSPLPAHAQSADACEQAQPKQRKGLFGARFAKLATAAGVAAISGRRATASAAADAAARDVFDNGRERAQEEAAAAAACATQAASASASAGVQAEAPRPAVAVTYSRPGEMPVPPEVEAQEAAFDEFGKVDCESCEGGYAYDSWARLAFASELRGEFNGWEKKLGALEPGQSLTWQGAENAGLLTVTGTEQVNGFDCKRLTYRLTRASESAERPGLLCWGKSSPYSASDSWVEVY